MNKILSIIAIALIVVSCKEEDVDKSVITQLGQIEVIGPNVIMTDESAGTISVDIDLSDNQIVPTSFLIEVDEDRSTATLGEDFAFEAMELEVDAFIQQATFDLEIFFDDLPEGTESIFFTVTPTDDFGVVKPHTFEVQIANGVSQDFKIINAWDEEFTFQWVDSTVTFGAFDTTIEVIDTIITITVSSGMIDTTFVIDTSFMGIDSTRSVVYKDTMFTISPALTCLNVDFDIYCFDTLFNSIFANWNNCPEVATLEFMPDSAGYSTVGDDVGPVELPYDQYIFALDLWANGLSTVPFWDPQVMPITTTFTKPGVFYERQITDTTFTTADPGSSVIGPASPFPLLYLVTLEDNFVMVSELDNTEIISGRYAMPVLERSRRK